MVNKVVKDNAGKAKKIEEELKAGLSDLEKYCGVQGGSPILRGDSDK